MAQLPNRIGIVVGLMAEARIARDLGRPAAGGGNAIGAEQAARRLIDAGVRALLSFGLAGGLDPALRPGALLIPREVLVEGERFGADPDLLRRLGGSTVELALADGQIADTPAIKRRLRQQSGASAIDTESGAVARVAQQRGVPFAVLRAICDPAERALPPAALIALDHAGSVRILRVLASVTAAPSQIPALVQLAWDGAIARRALIRRVAELRERLAGV